MKNLGSKISKIISVSQENYQIDLEFDDGEVVRVSLKNIFDAPKGIAVEVLKGQMFEKCFIDSGALAWPNGFELCADSIKKWSEEQRNPRAS